jgi:aminopeptidase N
MGDYTTMDWWNDLWLNEGFAEWAQYQATALVYPSWGIDDYFFEMEGHIALSADACSWTHPVHVEVLDPRNIGLLFDDISK